MNNVSILLFIFIFLVFILLTISNRFPFDTNNPIGFVIACILQYIMVVCMLMFVALLFCFGIGSFLITQSSTKKIQFCLKSIHKGAKSTDRLTMVQQFRDFIHFFANEKQLSIIASTHFMQFFVVFL